MKKALSLFMITLLLVFNFQSAGAEKPDNALVEWRDYSEGLFDLAKKEAKPVFMVITADWCHVCRSYEENTLNTKELAGFLNNYFIPVFADFEKDSELVAEYAVVGPPTTIIFSAEGEKVASIPGFVTKEDLLEGLEGALPHIKAGRLDEARRAFVLYQHERMSFDRSLLRIASPVMGAESAKSERAKPFKGISFMIFILLSGGVLYKIFKKPSQG
jgi:thioredoxin-related protein